MKHTFKIIIGFLTLTNLAFCQNIDTLKVYVMTPNKVEVFDNYLKEFENLKSDIFEKRNKIKGHKLADRQEHLDEYNKQPEYTKRMFENEVNFYDSLSLDNYISSVVREYIAYRLYRPFKIKPRLVFVETTKLNSDITEYQRFCQDNKNCFIINFPSLKVFKENYEIRVITKVELYSSSTKRILLTRESVGKPKAGMTDFPMCSGDNWDCAFVNSVYPNLFDIVKIIADNNTNKK